MEPAILTENLVKDYKSKVKSKEKSFRALLNLNLRVEQGDIYGFIGPNGAGKTTTIKILMGLIAPTSGLAWVMNSPAGSVEAKRQVGFLSETSYYQPFMEVGKLLDHYCSFYEIPHKERLRRVEEVLKMVNLSDKIDSKIKELSKGMQQRFGIAQAIIADPPVLILDELTSGLDPIAQKEVKDIVLNLKKQGKTIFFSSHQMTEVAMICDKIGIIHKGNMLKSDNLKNFLREESGALSKVVFQSSSDELNNAFKQKNIHMEEVRAGEYSVLVPEVSVNEIIDQIREAKQGIVEVIPHRYTLEDAFFKLIKKEREE